MHVLYTLLYTLQYALHTLQLLHSRMLIGG
jgi:hypothetical protein